MKGATILKSLLYIKWDVQRIMESVQAMKKLHYNSRGANHRRNVHHHMKALAKLEVTLYHSEGASIGGATIFNGGRTKKKKGPTLT